MFSLFKKKECYFCKNSENLFNFINYYYACRRCKLMLNRVEHYFKGTDKNDFLQSIYEVFIESLKKTEISRITRINNNRSQNNFMDERIKYINNTYNCLYHTIIYKYFYAKLSSVSIRP